jgi:hypothetical protein
MLQHNKGSRFGVQGSGFGKEEETPAIVILELRGPFCCGLCVMLKHNLRGVQATMVPSSGLLAVA